MKTGVVCFKYIFSFKIALRERIYSSTALPMTDHLSQLSGKINDRDMSTVQVDGSIKACKLICSTIPLGVKIWNRFIAMFQNKPSTRLSEHYIGLFPKYNGYQRLFLVHSSTLLNFKVVEKVNFLVLLKLKAKFLRSSTIPKKI